MSSPPSPPPPLRLEWQRLRYDTGRQETRLDGMRLNWGSFSIQADFANVERRPSGDFSLNADGSVVVARGGESIRGRSLRFDSGREFFAVDDATVAMSPLQIRARTLVRTPDRVVFTLFSLRPEVPGRPELQVDAREGVYDPRSDRMSLRSARFVVFGKPLVVLPRFSFQLGAGERRPESRLEFPLIWRQSATSGLATGFKTPLPLGREALGRAVWETTTLRGTQWLVDVERTIGFGPSKRRRFFSDPPGHVKGSPGFGLAAAPKPDPQKSTYQDFLTLPDLLVGPRDRSQILVGTTWQARREFVRRDAVVLISRSPQARLNVHHPVGNGFMEGEVSRGRVREETPAGTIARADRSAWLVRVATPPARVSESSRFQAQGSVTENRYDGGSAYRVAEGRIAFDRSFGGRNGIAAGVIARRTYGSTPFLFDLVEAGTEGQIRGQWSVHRVVGALAVRWDLGQGRVFDREIGIGWRGDILEPRLTYRTQGRQVSFSIGVASFGL